MGKPFSIGCRDGRATDCGGMVLDVASACGFQFEDLPHKYTLATSAGLTLYVHLRSVCDELEPSSARPGDLLLFWVRMPYHPQHLGILCGRTIVHASPLIDRQVSERRIASLATKVYATFRFRVGGAPAAHKVALNSQVVCERCVLQDPVKYSRPIRNFACAGC